jgi:hypothetical protein
VKELLDVVTRVYDIVFAQILRPPGPEKGLGCRTECFQSLTVVLRPVSVLLDHLILG